MDFIKLVMERIQITGNRSKFVELIIKSSNSTTETLDFVSEFTNSCTSILKIITFAFKLILET